METRGNGYTNDGVIDANNMDGFDTMLRHVIDDGHRGGLFAIDSHRTLVECQEHSAVAVGRSGDGAARGHHDVTIIVNAWQCTLREEQNLVRIEVEVRVTREKWGEEDITDDRQGYRKVYPRGSLDSS